jgi:aspartyl-tRNA(Asn)/glutamyl-tRNA(Gln) amidotransferase subunit B
VELIGFVERQEVSGLQAKSILADMIATGKPPSSIIKEKNLSQISDESSLDNVIEEAIKENPKSAQAYKQGKSNALMF